MSEIIGASQVKVGWCEHKAQHLEAKLNMAADMASKDPGKLFHFFFFYIQLYCVGRFWK